MCFQWCLNEIARLRLVYMCVRFHSAIQSFEIFMYPCVYFCVRHGIHEFEAFKRVCMCVCVYARTSSHSYAQVYMQALLCTS
jgi:hypothetical protein